DDRRVGARPPVEQARDERVRREDAEQPPESQRQATGPFVQTEQLETQRDRRERQLRTAEIVQVRQRVVGPLENEARRTVEVERDATREVGDVELVGVPQAARRQRRKQEEQEGRDGCRDRERGPARPGRRRLAGARGRLGGSRRRRRGGG